MGMIVQPSSGEVPEVPDSLYRATITAVTPIKLDEPDQFGKQDKLKIDLEFDIDGEPMTLDPRVNQAWSERATLFKIAVAAGLDPDPNDGFDVDLLVKRQVNILTEQEPGKWPRITAWSRVSTKSKASAKEQGIDFSKLSTPAAVVPPLTPESHVSEFWAETRSRGWERKDVLAISNDTYKREPADLTDEEREQLLGGM